jgi:hypothetical protein
MAIMDSLKDENGKLKKPILISLIGAGGLLAYLMLSKGSGGTTTSAGQSSPLTPDLTGLQTALQGLAAGGGGGGGGSGTGPSIDPLPFTPVGNPNPTPTPTPTPVTNNPDPTPTPDQIIPINNYADQRSNDPNNVAKSLTPVVLPYNTQQPAVAQMPGSSGSQGGGGGGTGQVIQPIAKSATVYGGVAAGNGFLGNIAPAVPKTTNSLTQAIAIYQAIPASQRTAKQNAALATDLATNARQAGVAATPILSSSSLTKTPVTAVKGSSGGGSWTPAPTVIAKQPVKGKSNTTKL